MVRSLIERNPPAAQLVALHLALAQGKTWSLGSGQRGQKRPSPKAHHRVTCPVKLVGFKLRALSSCNPQSMKYITPYGGSAPRLFPRCCPIRCCLKRAERPEDREIHWRIFPTQRSQSQLVTRARLVAVLDPNLVGPGSVALVVKQHLSLHTPTTSTSSHPTRGRP